MNSRIVTNLYIIEIISYNLYGFRDFPENAHSGNDNFREKLKKKPKGLFVKIREFTPAIIFCLIFPKKSRFRIKNENFEISRNSAQQLGPNYRDHNLLLLNYKFENPLLPFQTRLQTASNHEGRFIFNCMTYVLKRRLS